MRRRVTMRPCHLAYEHLNGIHKLIVADAVRVSVQETRVSYLRRRYPWKSYTGRDGELFARLRYL